MAASKTHGELASLKPGVSFPVGTLLGNVCPDEIELTYTEKVDGVIFFAATYIGIRLGDVQYNNGKWGWSK